MTKYQCVECSQFKWRQPKVVGERNFRDDTGRQWHGRTCPDCRNKWSAGHRKTKRHSRYKNLCGGCGLVHIPAQSDFCPPCLALVKLEESRTRSRVRQCRHCEAKMVDRYFYCKTCRPDQLAGLYDQSTGAWGGGEATTSNARALLVDRICQKVIGTTK